MSYPTLLEYGRVLRLPPGKRPFAPQLNDANHAKVLPPVGAKNPQFLHWGSGTFAAVFRLETKDGRALALRTPLRAPDADLGERFTAFQSYVASLKQPLECLVPLTYESKGISFDGAWFPLFVMQWVEGVSLYQHVENLCSAKRTGELSKLAEDWASTISILQVHEIAHGDLQHENVRIEKGHAIRLIDYDTVFVPDLEGRGAYAGIPGAEGYFHPSYGRGTTPRYDAQRDTFSALVILTSLLALAEEPTLWKANTAENLLFKSQDFCDPKGSYIFKHLDKSTSGRVRSLAGLLAETCQQADDSKLPNLGRLLPMKPHVHGGGIERKPRLKEPLKPIQHEPGQALPRGGRKAISHEPGQAIPPNKKGKTP